MSSRALGLMASLVLENGQQWGEVAARWQWKDAQAILDPKRRDPRMHFCTRPRGGAKTTDLAGIGGVALVELVPPDGNVFAIAADKDQARLVIDALRGLVARTPGLSGAITVDRYSAIARNGARFEVIPADAASSYGLKGSLYICDEISMWPISHKEVWVSILSAVPKVEGAQLVCLASAGDPAHWSFQIREHARKSKAWRLHEVPGPVPWINPEALVEQRSLLTDSQYARLHLGRWVASEDRLVSMENLAAAVRLDGPQDPRPGVTYRIGVDLGLRHDRTCIAVCHAEPVASSRARKIVLDRMIVFEGSKADEVRLAEVEAALVQAWRHYHRPKVRLDPWQAIGLAQRLRRRGVSVEEWSYSPQRYGAIATVLYTLLRDGLLDLYDDLGLLDELANVRLKETLPGLVRVEHDPGRHDDRAVALGFAATGLVERPPSGGRLEVASGDLPRTQLVRASVSPADLPVPVVRDGKRKQPGSTFRLGHFTVPRKGYTPPGSSQ